MRTLASALALVAALGVAVPASAYEAGDWLFRAGSSLVDPKSNNGSFGTDLEIKVDDQLGVTYNLTYMYSANLGIEVLAALPYEHDIAVGDLGTVASVKHLPPTVSLQYHFLPQGVFQPYAGLGLNYTLFFSEKTKGALAGSDIKVDSSSLGLAAQLGFDVMLNDSWFVNVDVRWIGIETEATVDNALKADVKIDPMVYGVHLGYRF
jgi:outer membrane protein